MNLRRFLAPVVASITLVGGSLGLMSVLSHRAPSVVTGNVTVVDQPFMCTGAVDISLLKVTENSGTGAKDGVVLGKGCTGNIGSIQVDMWTGDGIKVQNSAPVAHDLTIGGGYVVCHDKSPILHQDGIQVMGGTNILFSGLAIHCGRPDATFVDADFFVNKGGAGDSTPTNIICDGCTLGGGAAHTVNLGESLRSGVRNSCLEPDKTRFGGSFDLTGGAVEPVNENNVFLASCP